MPRRDPSSGHTGEPAAKSSTSSGIRKALLEKQQQMATIFETVQAGIILIDAETHCVIDANPKALQMIGAGRDEVCGASCHRFICPSENGRCPITDLNQEIDNSERVLLTKTGRPVPILKTVATVNLGDRNILVETFLDISDQKAAAKRIKESEERYRDLFENANDLIQSIYPDGSIAFVNKSWRETLGYSEAEVTDLNIRDIIHPDSMDHCMQAFGELLGGNSLDFLEATFITKDGRRIELEGSINCLFQDGKPVSSRGIFRNVTDRKEEERKRRESDARYREILENVHDLIQLVHPDGTFDYVNPAWENALGYQSNEISGLRFKDIVPEEYHADFLPALQRAFQGKKVERLETVFQNREGGRLHVEGSLSYQVQEGRLTHIRFIWRDITERKLAEEQMKEWNRQLEQKVEEKARELQEAQTKLLQTEKMSTIGLLVSGTAHEMSNPIGGILNAVDFLQQSKMLIPTNPASVDEMKWLAAIGRAAGRCQKIVDDLKKFSDYELCSFSPVDVNSVLDMMLEQLQPSLQEKNLQIVDQRQRPLPDLEGDALQLLQAFSNILENAITASQPAGTITIISAPSQSTSSINQGVEITFRDEGCGIPEELLSKVFDPFFTTRPVGQGTGLGLSVSYGIIKRHHGDIDLKSTLGSGTEVTIRLPLQQFPI